MIKSTKMLKRLGATFLVVLMSIESFAAVVGDNDGAAFITKAEFDSMKNDFQSQLDRYNSSLDNKIDGAIASYLSGVSVAQIVTQPLNEKIASKSLIMKQDTSFEISNDERVIPEVIMNIVRTSWRLNSSTKWFSYVVGLQFVNDPFQNGKELCLKKYNEYLKTIDGIYGDCSILCEFTGVSYGGDSLWTLNDPSKASPYLLRFRPTNGNLMQNISAFDFYAYLFFDGTNPDTQTVGHFGSMSATACATGAWSLNRNNLETWNTLFFNECTINGIPVDYTNSTVPEERISGISWKFKKKIAGDTYIATTGPAQQTNITFTGITNTNGTIYTLGRDAQSTSNLVSPLCFDTIEPSETTVPIFATLNSGVHLFTADKDVTLFPNLTTSDSNIQLAFADKPFENGFTTAGNRIIVDGFSYDSDGKFVCTNSELKNLKLNIRKGQDVYVKWRSTEDGVDSVLIFPKFVQYQETNI